jgi:hypothetical protein
MATEHTNAVPRSAQLLERGFVTFDDAWRCLEAVTSDVLAERVTVEEGRRINAAIHTFLRGQEGGK